MTGGGGGCEYFGVSRGSVTRGSVTRGVCHEGVPKACWDIQPPVDRMNDAACENITFWQLLLRAVNRWLHKRGLNYMANSICGSHVVN